MVITIVFKTSAAVLWAGAGLGIVIMVAGWVVWELATEYWP